MQHLRKNVFGLKIWNGREFVDFDGITKKKFRETLTVSLNDGSSLICTPNHKIKTKKKFRKAIDLEEGNKLENNTSVTSVSLNGFLTTVYDVVNSKTKTYQTNNVISHNCSFIGSSNTLIDSSVLAQIPITVPIQSIHNMNYFETPKQDHTYVMVVDVSRGRGKDYSAFSVIDITQLPYVVVATFKDNEIKPTIEFPMLIDKIGRYFNTAIVAIENNDLGESVGNALWYDFEYDNMIWSKDEEITSKGVIGYKTTRKLKQIGTSNLKSLIEGNQLVLNDKRIIDELEVFVRKKIGLYGAQDTKINDDLTATLWGFAWLEKTKYFEDVTNINSNKVMGKSFADDVDQFIPIIKRSDGTELYESNDFHLDRDQISMML